MESIRKNIHKMRSTAGQEDKSDNKQLRDAFYIDFSELVKDIRDNVSLKRNLPEMAQPTFFGLLPSSADIVSDAWQVRIQPPNYRNVYNIYGLE